MSSGNVGDFVAFHRTSADELERIHVSNVDFAASCAEEFFENEVQLRIARNLIGISEGQRPWF